MSWTLREQHLRECLSPWGHFLVISLCLFRVFGPLFFIMTVFSCRQTPHVPPGATGGLVPTTLHLMAGLGEKPCSHTQAASAVLFYFAYWKMTYGFCTLFWSRWRCFRNMQLICRCGRFLLHKLGIQLCSFLAEGILAFGSCSLLALVEHSSLEGS